MVYVANSQLLPENNNLNSLVTESNLLYASPMKELLILLAHLLTTVAKLLGPGGARAIVADSLLMKQQLLVINRSANRQGIRCRYRQGSG